MGTHIEDMERGRVEFLDLDGDTPLAREAAASVALDGDTGHCPQCEAWGRRQAELARILSASDLETHWMAVPPWTDAEGRTTAAGEALLELLTGHAPGEGGGQDGNG